MVWLRVICLLLGALAVMALTPLAAAASASSAPPCHVSDTGHHPSPVQPDQPAPEKPMKAMGCCVVCTSAALAERVAAPVERPVSASVAPALSADGRGLRSGPEPHPPRA